MKKFCHPNHTSWSNDFLVEESLSFCEDEECHRRDEGTIAAALKISPADSDLNCCMQCVVAVLCSVLCVCVFKKSIYQGRVDWSNLICCGFRHSTSTSPTPFFFLSRFGHRHQELLVITVWYIVLWLVWLGRDGLTMCKTKLFPYTQSSKICSPL